MNKVAIVGAGITECRGRWVEATYWDLFQQATRRTLADAKITADEVDSAVYGIYNNTSEHQAILEGTLTGLIGLANKPGVRITIGGATGFYAMPPRSRKWARAWPTASSASAARRRPTATTRRPGPPRRWLSTPSPSPGTPSASTPWGSRRTTRRCSPAWGTTTPTPATSAPAWSGPGLSRWCAARGTATPIRHIKGKSAIRLTRENAERKQNFVGQHVWARGHFVSTVGRDEGVIREWLCGDTYSARSAAAEAIQAVHSAGTGSIRRQASRASAIDRWVRGPASASRPPTRERALRSARIRA